MGKEPKCKVGVKFKIQSAIFWQRWEKNGNVVALEA